jgi:hypothetical protein
MQKGFLTLSVILTLGSCGMRVRNHLYLTSMLKQGIDLLLILKNAQVLKLTNTEGLICQTEIEGKCVTKDVYENNAMH